MKKTSGMMEETPEFFWGKVDKPECLVWCDLSCLMMPEESLDIAFVTTIPDLESTVMEICYDNLLHIDFTLHSGICVSSTP